MAFTIAHNIEKVNIKTAQMSINKLTSKTIKQIPVVLGEADIIKSIILLPGVTSAGEGASGFNVRGGAVDQNLILLDEAIVFNSSHVFGSLYIYILSHFTLYSSISLYFVHTPQSTIPHHNIQYTLHVHYYTPHFT